MIENKVIMSKNIQYYMDKNNVTATDVCKACGFKQNTFSDWVNAKIYPRIDKIEIMANYFGVTKADLVEDREARNIRDLYANVDSEILELAKKDPQVMEFIKLFMNTEPENRPAVLQILKGLQHNPSTPNQES